MRISKRTKVVLICIVTPLVFSGAIYFGIQSVAPNGGDGSMHTDATVEANLAQKVYALDVMIEPLSLLEDSRCPSDVACVREGALRLKTRIQSGLGESEEIFEIGTSITTEAEIITLRSVRPAPKSDRTISANEYVFVFDVAKR